jgi:hypothetical protein
VSLPSVMSLLGPCVDSPRSLQLVEPAKLEGMFYEKLHTLALPSLTVRGSEPEPVKGNEMIKALLCHVFSLVKFLLAEGALFDAPSQRVTC